MSSPRASRQTYLRRRISVALAVLAILAILGGAAAYAAAALTRTPAAIQAQTTSFEFAQPASDAGAAIDWPDEGAGALTTTRRGGVLSSFGGEEPRPMASITKTITALVVLDEHPLGANEAGPDIPITQADADIFWRVIAEGGSSAAVYPGTVFSQRNMLDAVMLPSANNYAESLVVWAFGSEDAFLERAAAWLDEQGLTDTTLADSSGIDERSVSTPADLVEVGRLALAEPVLADIVSSTSAQLPSVGEIENTNRLLGERGVTGLKTGTTNAAGACLLFSADIDVEGQRVTVVGVILGAPLPSTLYAGVEDVLDSAPAGFRTERIVDAGEAVGSYVAPWGGRAGIVASRDLTEVVWGEDEVSVSFETPELVAGESGDAAGTLVATSPGRETGVPLTLTGSLGEPSPWWRLANPAG